MPRPASLPAGNPNHLYWGALTHAWTFHATGNTSNEGVDDIKGGNHGTLVNTAALNDVTGLNMPDWTGYVSVSQIYLADARGTMSVVWRHDHEGTISGPNVWGDVSLGTEQVMQRNGANQFAFVERTAPGDWSVPNEQIRGEKRDWCLSIQLAEPTLQRYNLYSKLPGENTWTHYGEIEYPGVQAIPRTLDALGSGRGDVASDLSGTLEYLYTFKSHIPLDDLNTHFADPYSIVGDPAPPDPSPGRPASLPAGNPNHPYWGALQNAWTFHATGNTSNEGVDDIKGGVHGTITGATLSDTNGYVGTANNQGVALSDTVVFGNPVGTLMWRGFSGPNDKYVTLANGSQYIANNGQGNIRYLYRGLNMYSLVSRDPGTEVDYCLVVKTDDGTNYYNTIFSKLPGESTWTQGGDSTTSVSALTREFEQISSDDAYSVIGEIGYLYTFPGSVLTLDDLNTHFADPYSIVNAEAATTPTIGYWSGSVSDDQDRKEAFARGEVEVDWTSDQARGLVACFPMSTRPKSRQYDLADISKASLYTDTAGAANPYSVRHPIYGAVTSNQPTTDADIVYRPAAPELNSPSEHTLMCWAYSTDVINKGFVSRYGGFGLYQWEGTLRFHPHGGSYLDSTSSVTAGQWAFLAGAWNASTGEYLVFANGTRVSGTSTAGISDTAFFRVGRTDAGFGGVAVDVRLYHRAMPVPEIEAIYRNGHLLYKPTHARRIYTPWPVGGVTPPPTGSPPDNTWYAAGPLKMGGIHSP